MILNQVNALSVIFWTTNCYLVNLKISFLNVLRLFRGSIKCTWICCLQNFCLDIFLNRSLIWSAKLPFGCTVNPWVDTIACKTFWFLLVPKMVGPRDLFCMNLNLILGNVNEELRECSLTPWISLTVFVQIFFEKWLGGYHLSKTRFECLMFGHS